MVLPIAVAQAVVMANKGYNAVKALKGGIGSISKAYKPKSSRKPSRPHFDAINKTREKSKEKISPEVVEAMATNPGGKMYPRAPKPVNNLKLNKSRLHKQTKKKFVPKPVPVNVLNKDYTEEEKRNIRKQLGF